MTTLPAPTAPVPAVPPTTLVLARHGRTELTAQGRFSGRSGEPTGTRRADPPLSAAGGDDALALAGLLAGPGWEVDAVVSSPLRRAVDTARHVAGPLGLAVREDDAWSEADFGAWEGLTWAEAQARDPALVRDWQASSAVAPPGGESLDAVVARVRTARARVVEENPGRTVLVVTSATPVRAVVHEALHAGTAALWRLRVTPGAVTVVRWWPDGGVEVVTVNATAHLGALGAVLTPR